MNKRLRECISTEESQLWFISGRGTTDDIFGLKQIVEKHRECQTDISLVVV